MDDPFLSLHLALSHAVHEGFPAVEMDEIDRNKTIDPKNPVYNKKIIRHGFSDVSILAMFEQGWSSTALGFGGIGGQSMTSAYTIIVESGLGSGCCVYFGGRFAYRIEKPNARFVDDMNKRDMSKVFGARSLYERK